MVAVLVLAMVFIWITSLANETVHATNNTSVCLLHNQSTGLSTLCNSSLQMSCTGKKHIFIKDVSYFKIRNLGYCHFCNGIYDPWIVNLVLFEGILCEQCQGAKGCVLKISVPVESEQDTVDKMVWFVEVAYDCIERDMYIRGRICNQTQNKTEVDTTMAFKSSTKAVSTTMGQTQTSLLMEHSVTRCTSQEVSMITSNAVTHNNSKHTSDSEVPLSVIIGGTAGGLTILVIVIVISCFAFKCRRRISTKAQEAYSKAFSKTKKKSSSNVMVGVHNLSYEHTSVRNNINLQHTHGDANIKEYDEPIDVAFKASDLQSRTCQEENCLYEETFDGCLIPGVRPSVNYATLMKLAKARDKPKDNAYAEDYSHMQGQTNSNILLKQEDNYFHTNPVTSNKMLEHPMENQYSHVDESDRIDFANTNNEYSHIVLTSIRNEIKREQCYGDEDQYNHI